MEKVTVIITVLNEESTILELLKSLEKQSLLPTEVIVVDGGSKDKTIKIVNNFSSNSFLNIRLLQKKGNRSVGRNLAIAKSKTDLIAITDAGCVTNKNWLKELVETQKETKSQVVAGYYAGKANTRFEEAVIPYALVMPEKVNPDEFLPATRSMLLRKKVWEKLGGFDEELSDNEDYAFATKIRKNNIKIAFAEKAIVLWKPRNNLPSFFRMIYRFARGDVRADILRPKVALIFLRYFLLLLTTIFVLKFSDWKSVIQLWTPLFVIYSLWAIDKNLKYTPKSWFYLPLLQISSDIAVMFGSIAGLIR
ncbi:MAG: hypothetical protein COU65_02000 [Candidatus Pacebacteria bacterium CG10_big_fil_rev_8_21_14_0_10_42_12]|nr:glycosyltransferase [Candidatus Paceibacterota bacterium]PIR62735.1 MAG: hypothetical protein COU65_02000 [Candidatus Pacebacteria bacterium CG10_big_fil_rev_8_21_14_0_10_42_12]